jgi:uncharacterized protein (TIGR02145 family)
MKRFFLLFLILFSALITYGQSPSSFRYQAVLRDSKGAIKANASATIIISILQGSATGSVVYSESHSTTTDNFGLVSLEIGKGTVTSGTFSSINWSSGTFYVKVTVDGVEMGTTQLLSVPYALYATKAGNGFSGSYNDLTNKPALANVATSGSYNDLLNKPALFDGVYSNLTGKPTYAAVATSGSYSDLLNKPVLDTMSHFTVKGKTSDLGEALFEVRNKNGQTVFAVYNEGVRIYVDDGAKGPKGGFAIGGFGTSKAPSQTYFSVSGDSIRAYINESAKGPKGGFAIGGYGSSKGLTPEYLRVTPDSTRITFNEPTVKGSKGGFAIGEIAPTKGTAQDLLTINMESIRMYIDDNPVKGPKGGFAIGGFSGAKGTIQEFLRVTSDSTRLWFDDSQAKGSKGGFAIGGYNNSKGGNTKYLLINQDSSNFYVTSQGAKGSNTYSSFNIMSFDPTSGWSPIMNANPDTISMSSVLSVESNFEVNGNIAYSGTVARDTIPTVITSYIYNITKNTASVDADIVSNGGATVIESGVCWSTSITPIISGSHTKDGSLIGSFTSNITGLTFNTKYYVRAYATNNKGIAYGDTISFFTAPDIPTLTTTAATNIKADSARTGGNITSDGGSQVFERGVCWSTSHNPTTNDNRTYDDMGMGVFVSTITGLSPNTTYYIRAFATNDAGTAYGNELSFTTMSISLPVLTTTSISGITTNSAVSGGNITSDGYSPVTERGVCWSTAPSPSTSDSRTYDAQGSGSFISYITGLSEGTTYHVRAYAINGAGTAYGSDVSFTTTTTGGSTVQDIDGNTYNTITIGSQVWITENLKTTKYSDGTTIPLVTDPGAWQAQPTPGYTFYNNDGATYQADYGALYNFYAIDPATNGGKNVCPTGWHVPYDGEWTVLTDYLGGEALAGGKLKETGLTHWLSPNSDATNSSGFTAFGGGARNYMGLFMSMGDMAYFWTLTSSMNPNAFYRSLLSAGGPVVKSDIMRNFGMSVRCIQGNASPQAPSVLTAPPSAITTSSASTGGNVVNDGGAAVTQRGVCWSTTPHPTITNNPTNDGSGSGTFISNISGLSPGVTYFVRAYATNSVGTGYGPEVTFTAMPAK